MEQMSKRKKVVVDLVESSEEEEKEEEEETINILLLDICVTHSEQDPPIVHLLGKDAQGKRVHVQVKGFLNYFYAEPSKWSQDVLLQEEGVVSVELVQRIPLFFYRRDGERLRNLFKVKYWFRERKRQPKEDEGRFETNIKWRRRFQTETNLGSGCTVRCGQCQVTSSPNDLVLEACCDYQRVSRVLDDEITPTILSVISLDLLRTHHPARPITGRCLEEKHDPITVIACHQLDKDTIFVLDDSVEETVLEQNQLLISGRLASFVRCGTTSVFVNQFADFIEAQDPDVIVGWDIVSSLESIAYSLRLSRLDPSLLRLKSKLMTNYNARWVRRPVSRMSSSSNQKTFKLTEGVEGRLLLDLLRTTITKHKLQHYTLAESAEVFLRDHKRSAWLDCAMQDTDQATLSAMWRSKDEFSRLRVIDWVSCRSITALALCEHQSLIPETLQAGSIALLLLGEVLYGAQMVRVHSLMLRKMHDLRYVTAGSSDRSDPVLSDPINAPFLIHPEEEKTAKLYTMEEDGPIAVLDFASLYPSIIIAFNLCYSTYVHPTERTSMFSDIPPPRRTGSATKELTNAPAIPETAAVERHVFVTEQVFPGLLPALLRDLLSQRDTVKQEMERVKSDAVRWAVLDQRQKQLKLCANAAYGFTGATTASPIPFASLAESTLRWGQALCRKACSVVTKQFPSCRVIYGQTDSLFICLGRDVITSEAANAKAHRIADEITKAIGRPPVRLRVEKVFDRMLLQHVNRYAGRLMSSPPIFEVTGMESESRKECLLVRKAVKLFLTQIIQNPGDPFQFMSNWFKFDLQRTLPSELVVTHALWRTENVQEASEDESQPHLVVAKRLCDKDEDMSFVLGERVSFIFRTHADAKKQAEKARDPFEESNVPPDMPLYLKNKVLPPLGRIGRVVDGKKWSVVESEANKSSSTVAMTVVTRRGPTKCLGKPGCRLLTVNNNALCERCMEEGLTPASRARMEKDFARVEHEWFRIVRARQRSYLMIDSVGKEEFLLLDHAHLADELAKLGSLLDDRIWC